MSDAALGNGARQSYMVTTPIYYVNAAPHLGTAYTTIAADVVARYKRMDGFDVAFVTGMDEHGQKVADTAHSAGMEPQAWCDSMEPVFRDAWNMLDIEYSDFVRTTEDRHARSVRKFWQLIYDKGYLYKGAYEGWYCVHEETYYSESDLEKNDEGIFVCPDCGRPVQRMSSGEENWFFRLSDFQHDLLDFYDAHPDFIRPATRRNEVISFVKGGLKDLSISRSTFDWGVPLPFDKGHVAYVWADALVTYLTGVGYADDARSEEFERMWPPAYHFVGKDIIRFHCVIWPAMLMAAGLPIAHTVFAHGFLLTKGEKMSKSKGNALSPADLVAIFGVDAYRYYFMSDVQFGHDGTISIERMVQVYNSDLANTWGNLVSRTLNMTKRYFDGFVPDHDGEEKNPLRELATGLYDRYRACMDIVDFTGAAASVMELASRANLYIEEMEPFRLAKDETKKVELAQVIYNLLETIRIIALYMAPFAPNTSQEVYRRLGLGSIEDAQDLYISTSWGGLDGGLQTEVGEPLFPRLDVDNLPEVQ